MYKSLWSEDDRVLGEAVKRMAMDRYYLVREDILPEAIIKTMQAKELLTKGEARTINEAVDRVGLSRSAFYKYKDGVYSLNKLDRERLVTVSLDLDHRAGILSKVLACIARLEGNVLTIHQSIPLQGLANVVLSIDTSRMGEQFGGLIESLKTVEGVRRAAIIGQGWRQSDE